MSNSDYKELTIEQLENILISAVVKKIQFSMPELIVTVNTMLKADAEIDVFDFGDILIHLFNKTDWMIHYELIIDWFTKNETSIADLAENILYVKSNYNKKIDEV
ncbi:MAG: hypothetical protein JNL69_00625 [Bacteroidia bacterium]|nr:hypothetical protein [Bacteroidia bacterium]